MPPALDLLLKLDVIDDITVNIVEKKYTTMIRNIDIAII
jgi:hypothetical protein